MFLLKLHIIQGEFGPEKAERSCLRLFPTQSCHARCWPVVCSSTPGAFEYCTGLGWMSPRPFCRCACQNGTEFRWTTCCARAPEMGAACCTRGQHATPKPIEALARVLTRLTILSFPVAFRSPCYTYSTLHAGHDADHDAAVGVDWDVGVRMTRMNH